ncbi:hypothetical protein HAX54_021055, partial [Datura stramonium]|nr:hypothetical protein [Datura stramonium]
AVSHAPTHGESAAVRPPMCWDNACCAPAIAREKGYCACLIVLEQGRFVPGLVLALLCVSRPIAPVLLRPRAAYSANGLAPRAWQCAIFCRVARGKCSYAPANALGQGLLRACHRAGEGLLHVPYRAGTRPLHAWPYASLAVCRTTYSASFSAASRGL